MTAIVGGGTMVGDRARLAGRSPTELLSGLDGDAERAPKVDLFRQPGLAFEARTMVGATAPRASATCPSSASCTRQAEAVEITMALRVPTLAYPCHPRVTGTVTEWTNSPGRREFRLTPVMKSEKWTSRE